MFIEGEYDIDRLAAQPRHHAAESGQVDAKELARKHEILRSSSEPRKTRLSFGNSELGFVETDLLHAVVRCPRHHRIAEIVEMSEVDALAIRYQLLVERDAV